MIKKLVLGLVACCGLVGVMSGNAVGMEGVSYLISDLSNDSGNVDKLRKLVCVLVDEHNGSDATSAAISALKGFSANGALNRIDCMIGAISADWYEGYRRIHPVEYYVEGAANGAFGPYDLCSEKCCK